MSNRNIEKLKDLQSFNTLKLPSKAKNFSEFDSLSDLLTLVQVAEKNNLSVKVLGGGSNVIMPPEVDGLVLKPSMQGVQLLRENSEFRWLRVEAGKGWHQWVLESQAYGHGLENLALIPGTVGASPIQNIGAYGVEVADVLDSVQGICLSSHQLMALNNADCRFAYRDSIFKRELKNDFIVTSVVFRLAKKFDPKVSYGPLAHWAKENEGFSSQQLIDQVCAVRASKLPDPRVIPNAGSFFKNPLVTKEFASRLISKYPSLPSYPQGNGQVKLAAGWLIEQAGWKGKQLGNAAMHSLQALVLTTNGNANLGDVFLIRDAVAMAVFEMFSVELEAEPQVF